MMVLVDTPVWIRYFAGRQPYLGELRRLLVAEQVLGHELVYGELLIGDSRGRAAMLALYEKIQHTADIPHSEVVGFVRNQRLFGRGLSWIDAHMLASTMAARARLWTTDIRLADAASSYGVQYRLD